MTRGSTDSLSTLYSTRLTVPVPFYFEERNQQTAEKKKRLQLERVLQERKVCPATIWCDKYKWCFCDVVMVDGCSYIHVSDVFVTSLLMSYCHDIGGQM